MHHLLALSTVLGDGVKIDIGSFHTVLTVSFLIYLLVAAIIGLVAEFIVGWRLPLGFIGAIIAALIGIWLMTQVIHITGVGDIDFFGIPLIRALIGAIIFVAIWHLITYSLWRGRSRRRSYGA